MYPTATAQRTDSMIWPPRGTEMSGWERIEEMMRGGENERGRVDEGNQGAEGSCDDGLWNGDPPKVGSKGFEEIPLEVLSKRQKKRWAMLYQGNLTLFWYSVLLCANKTQRFLKTMSGFRLVRELAAS